MIVADQQSVIDHTLRWVSTLVIGLNLCPFAQRVFRGGSLRCAVSDAHDAATLLADLKSELAILAAASAASVETTLLIHPHVFGDFLDHNDFQGDCEDLLGRLGLIGTIQIAHFHPHYHFEGTAADDAENYTNRSPYPMLHLLREDSIAAVAEDPEELLEIPRRNIETMNDLGKDKILQMLREIEKG